MVPNEPQRHDVRPTVRSNGRKRQRRGRIERLEAWMEHREPHGPAIRARRPNDVGSRYAETAATVGSGGRSCGRSGTGWRATELRAVWDEMEAWRLEGQGRFVAMLAGKGAIRAGLSLEAARDAVWTLCSLAVHDLLVVERGWTSERYQEWLAGVLTCELLPDDRA
jgi:hypothetical protein